MITARITEFGDSAVVVLSKEMLAQLGVRLGDEVNVGPANSDRVAQQVEAAERIMEKRHEVLRRLAE
jgi:putative addiction module antidote